MSSSVVHPQGSCASVLLQLALMLDAVFGTALARLRADRDLLSRLDPRRLLLRLMIARLTRMRTSSGAAFHHLAANPPRARADRCENPDDVEDDDDWPLRLLIGMRPTTRSGWIAWRRTARPAPAGLGRRAPIRGRCTTSPRPVQTAQEAASTRAYRLAGARISYRTASTHRQAPVPSPGH